jgi:hypothetical protein
LNFACELTFRALQREQQAAGIESVFANLKGKTPIVSPEMLKWEFMIGRRSIRACYRLQEGMRIPSQDHSRDNRHLLVLVGTGYFVDLEFRAWRLFTETMVYAGCECGM